MAEHVYNDAQFRAQFPAFASAIEYPEGLLSGYFTMAACYIDAHDYCRLTGDCLQLALNLMTAHLVASNHAVVVAGTPAVPDSAPGAITSSAIDKVSVSFQIPTGSGPFLRWLAKTGFGQSLAALLRVKAAGGTYVGGSPQRAAFRR